MWDGVFLPKINKHRDFAHNSFFEHEMENGGEYAVVGGVVVDSDPIDESPYDPPRRHYAVDFKLHTGEDYVFLVPPEPDNSPPNEKRVGDTINAYVAHPIEGGRDYRDYIDFEATNELWAEEGETDRFGAPISMLNADDLLRPYRNLGVDNPDGDSVE